MGSAPARKAADFSASGRLRSKPRFSEVTTESGLADNAFNPAVAFTFSGKSGYDTAQH
jgi:hypothetical protein